MLIFIFTHHTSWKSSSEKRNPLQCTFTDSRWELRDATLQMMQPPSGYSSNVWRMPIVWLLAAMRKDLKHSVMQYLKLRGLTLYSNWTTTIFPPSTVSMMLNDEDHCFQCQEQGYIARNCPNIRCFKCDEYCHIVMDCPHRIPPLGTPAKHHQAKLH